MGRVLAGRSAAGLAGIGGAVRLWDVASRRESATVRTASLAVYSAAFSPDSRSLATGGAEGGIRLWDVGTGHELAAIPGHAGPVLFVAFSPDGRRLTSAAGTAPCGSGTSPPAANLACPAASPFQPVACRLSPDGRLLASAGGDGVVRLRDMTAGRDITELRGHSSFIYSLTFSPDGRRIASAGGEGVVRVWDPATGRELAALRGHRNNVTCEKFSPDSRLLVSAGEDGTLRLWDATPMTPVRRAQREAVALVRFLVDRAGSSADLCDLIRRGPVISEDVRVKALELAGGFWESARARDAGRLLPPLFREFLSREEVAAALLARPALTSEVRDRALGLARSWPESPDMLNSSSWNVCQEPGRDPTSYLRALHWAEAACRYQPNSGAVLNTLGVAQYRSELYREALDTLTAPSNDLNKGSQPSDLAFLAMAQQRLGQMEQARRTLTELRARMKRGPVERPGDGREHRLPARGRGPDRARPRVPVRPVRVVNNRCGRIEYNGPCGRPGKRRRRDRAVLLVSRWP